MLYMMAIYLLLSAGLGQTVSEQRDYAQTYVTTGQLPPAPPVKPAKRTYQAVTHRYQSRGQK